MRLSRERARGSVDSRVKLKMRNIKIKKKGLSPFDYIIIIPCAVLICTLVSVFTAGLIALPIQLIHKLTYGPR